jgi:hypothetical protein
LTVAILDEEKKINNEYKLHLITLSRVQLVERWFTIREVQESNPIGDIAFFGDKI